jgi:hypothetical protein
MLLGGALRCPICTYFASCVISNASRTTSLGIVAEKSSVCRAEGSAEMIRRTSGQKPHVHHPVGLVEDQQFDGAQVGVLLPHVIHQTPRRGDDDVDAA